MHQDPSSETRIDGDPPAEPDRAPAEGARAPEIPDELLDPDAVKVVGRLRRTGFLAYLVGGCVRDLLLGMRPKDFDVATSAHPSQVKDTFRNSRLIGRRFRLAHIFFRGGKIIEVSTFRANPLDELQDLPQDLLIRHDNVFGSAEEDARRRDFTINGLFYDVDDGRVIDYVGGKDDLRARLIRTIGNPDVRMREDPVRILRAIRFAAKCAFELEPNTLSAMRAHVHEIPRCAPPRVLEEVLKLIRSGASRRSFELLREVGALREPADLHDERLGGNPAFAVGTDVQPWSLPQDAVAPDIVLSEMVRTARLPRRIAERSRMILLAQPILSGERRRRRSSPQAFVRQSYFPEALAVFELSVAATGQGHEQLAKWQHLFSGQDLSDVQADEERPQAGAPRKRRSRGGRRRRGRGKGR